MTVRPRLQGARIRNPPGHWRLLVFLIIVLLVVVVFQGFATHTVGSTGETDSAGAAALPRHAGPILAVRGSRLVSIAPPPGRRVALTFDDGPSPQWTSRIARELHDAGVRATFFEIGSQAARYPGIVKQLIRDGDEIGNHTWTHAFLDAIPEWQRRLQIELTEAVFAGETGHYSRLIRPPYSSEPNAITVRDQRVLTQLAGHSYFVILSDYDSSDWQRPGVKAIVRNAMPPGKTGGIILFHDGGGNRSETAAAVPLVVKALRARGFQLVPVSQLAGIPPSVAMPPARGWAQTRSEIFVASVHVAYGITIASTVILLMIAALVVLRTLLLFVFATLHVVKTRRSPATGAVERPEYLPSVSIVVPAYNEEVNIERTVRSLAASDYPGVEVVVVDDGSSDRTAEIVEGLDLESVRLVRQDNAGKAAALQTGVELTTSEVICMVDGDTLFEARTLRMLVQPFADERVGAVSGNTKVGNRHGILGLWQHIEYVIGFNLDRRMYDVLQCMPTVPGAIGAFRRTTLNEVGGVPGDTLAEDTDLTLAVGRTGQRVVYVEEARAWTEAPSTLRALWRQRYRWSYGTMQSWWKHRGAIVSRDPRQRRIGWITLPYMLLFQILLPFAGPMIDLFAIYGLLFEGAVRTLVVWGAFNVLLVGTAAYGLWMDRERLRTLWSVPLQQFVYRQMMYLVIIESLATALQGRRSGWRKLARTGDAVVGGAQ